MAHHHSGSRFIFSLLFGVAFAIQIAGCASPPTQPGGDGSAETREAKLMKEVSGTAIYRERIALPPDATFEATLEDVSRAGAPSQVIGRVRLEPAGQPPFRFVIAYDANVIQSGHRYAIRARVTQSSRLLFTTDQHYELPADGKPVELLLVRAQRDAVSASTATLENTYWKVMTVGGKPISIGDRQGELHVVLRSEDRRVTGFGGCNRFTGSYSLAGSTLTFSKMAATMMACVEGMEQEQALHDTFEKTVAWRINGETLELLDASGASLALLESRYLQ